LPLAAGAIGRSAVSSVNSPSVRAESTALQPGVEFLGAESAVAAGDPQRIHDAVAIRVRCPQVGQVIRHGSHVSKADRPQ
jgi:hypothetical protein